MIRLKKDIITHIEAESLEVIIDRLRVYFAELK